MRNIHRRPVTREHVRARPYTRAPVRLYARARMLACPPTTDVRERHRGLTKLEQLIRDWDTKRETHRWVLLAVDRAATSIARMMQLPKSLLFHGFNFGSTRTGELVGLDAPTYPTWQGPTVTGGMSWEDALREADRQIAEFKAGRRSK